MTDKNDSTYVATQLSLPPNVHVSDYQRNVYKNLHKKLPKMKKNKFSIHGADIKIINQNRIIVTAFISSTVEKPLRLKPSVIVLLDEDTKPFAEVEVDFTELGVLAPNTARPWSIEFTEDSFLQQDTAQLSKWSLAFEKKMEHKVDYSGMDEEMISQGVKHQLNEIIKKAPLDKDEISLMGLSAKFDEESNLVTTLLIRNGTNRNIDVKQLPLKFFDAKEELSAQGTFRLERLTVLANTSKPITLVFPSSSILKPDMDLSKWSIVHNE